MMNEVTILSQCEICGKEPEPRKKRCLHCSQRYDANKVAYVIYCDFYRFEPSTGSGEVITLWMADGKVQRAPEQFKQLVGKTDEEAVELMCTDGYGLEIWKAQVK